MSFLSMDSSKETIKRMMPRIPKVGLPKVRAPRIISRVGYRASHGLSWFLDGFRWYRIWGTLPVRAWLKGASLFKAESFREASEWYRRGLEANRLHPAAPSARLDLAYCLYRTDLYEEALAELSMLVSERTNLKDVYLLRARIQMILGKPLSAADTMRQCAEIFPNDVQVLSCFMHSALVSRYGEDSLHALKRQLSQLKRKLSLEDNSNIHLDTALAHYELRLGDLIQGERMLVRVLATGTAPFEAVLLRGERMLEQGRLLPAREQLTRAMRAAPRDPRPVALLAKSYLRPGPDYKPDWAIQLAESAARLSHWQNADCLSILARAYESNNEKSKAQLYLERMKQLASSRELNRAYFQSSLQHLRAQKVSNT